MEIQLWQLALFLFAFPILVGVYWLFFNRDGLRNRYYEDLKRGSLPNRAIEWLAKRIDGRHRPTVWRIKSRRKRSSIREKQPM